MPNRRMHRATACVPLAVPSGRWPPAAGDAERQARHLPLVRFERTISMRIRTSLTPGLVLLLTYAVASAQGQYFDSLGVPVRFVDQGSGEPIFLL